jgi:protein-tyrosine-phosphatase
VIVNRESEEILEALPAGLRVLVLCTHNSARSQMAEGLLRHLSGGRIAAFSAGTEATRVHPLAIAAMAGAGIDIAGQRSKHLGEFAGQPFDYVITVCDSAGESCPVFPGTPQRIHWSIPDPSAVEGSEEKRLKAFQAAMADLETRLGNFLNALARRA